MLTILNMLFNFNSSAILPIIVALETAALGIGGAYMITKNPEVKKKVAYMSGDVKLIMKSLVLNVKGNDGAKEPVAGEVLNSNAAVTVAETKSEDKAPKDEDITDIKYLGGYKTEQNGSDYKFFVAYKIPKFDKYSQGYFMEFNKTNAELEKWTACDEVLSAAPESFKMETTESLKDKIDTNKFKEISVLFKDDKKYKFFFEGLGLPGQLELTNGAAKNLVQLIDTEKDEFLPELKKSGLKPFKLSATAQVFIVKEENAKNKTA